MTYEYESVDTSEIEECNEAANLAKHHLSGPEMGSGASRETVIERTSGINCEQDKY